MIETWHLEYGHEIVHEFARGNLNEEGVSAVLDADVGQLGDI